MPSMPKPRPIYWSSPSTGTRRDARCWPRCTTSNWFARSFRKRCCSRASRLPGARPPTCWRPKTWNRRGACAKRSTTMLPPARFRRPARRRPDLMIAQALISPFTEFEFMRRALAAVIALSLAGAPIGVFLMLRRMSLVGDAMAHAILPGAAIGFLLSGLNLVAMILGGLIAGFLVALLAGVVARSTGLKEDASLATFYLASLALGVTIVSVKGTNIDRLHVLFGNILAMDDRTLLVVAFNATITLLVLAVIYRPLVIESVDPLFLRTVSRAGGPAHLAFLALVVINLVNGFQALGTLLAVGLMILPAGIARFWSGDITGLICVAVASAIVSGYAGLVLSFHTKVPSGPAIILVAAGLYVASVLFGNAGGLVRQLIPRRHLEA